MKTIYITISMSGVQLKDRKRAKDWINVGVGYE